MKILGSLLATAVLLLAACAGGGGGDGGAPASGTGGTGTVGVPAASADISLLFMGNSHTAFHDVPGMVAAMVRAANPGKTVAAVQAPGWSFLEERLGEAGSVNLLRSQEWTFVVLQAQKYSSSGQFTYSTVEAIEWVRQARVQKAIPVMFPEWPRRGVGETRRIYDIHVSIAERQPACVAAIGQAWDLALARHPSLQLYDDDGNHAQPAGAFLAALMLYATMTDRSPATLPDFNQPGVPTLVQAQLRAVAADTLQILPARQWCPADRTPAP